jgi:Neuraminidase (sialidase)
MTRSIAVVIAGLVVFLVSATALAADETWIEPRCSKLPFDKLGPFVHLSDGKILCLQGNTASVTTDVGKTWSGPRPIYDGPKPGIPGNSVAVRTRAGAIVVVFADQSTYQWSWDDATRAPADDVNLDVWSTRSLDDGKTWTDRQRILDGYCGALIDMIQTSTGRIAVPVQDLFRNPGRHEIRPYYSDDDGKTWHSDQVIDLGGHGHHDGAMEPTLAELSDGRVLMLIRTNWDYFWEAFSEDHGRCWRTIRPSRIDASSAPGHLLRLKSSRLALVWNRRYPEGKNDVARSENIQASEAAASWHRQELALAFSQDDGKTWSRPVVITRRQDGGLSYPYLFEPTAGELWVFTRFSYHVGLALKEADFAAQ